MGWRFLGLMQGWAVHNQQHVSKREGMSPIMFTDMSCRCEVARTNMPSSLHGPTGLAGRSKPSAWLQSNLAQETLRTLLSWEPSRLIRVHVGQQSVYRKHKKKKTPSYHKSNRRPPPPERYGFG